MIFRSTFELAGGKLEFPLPDSSSTDFISAVEELREGREVEITISFRAKLSDQQIGYLRTEAMHAPTIQVDEVKHPRTLLQNATLRGIERFICWAQNNRKPAHDDPELYWIHEGILEAYSKHEKNPKTGRVEPIRTSDPRMTKKLMARLIEGALDELGQQQIPRPLLEVIGHDMESLWIRWYKWIGSKDAEWYRDAFPVKSWDEYVRRHPACEFSFQPPTEEEPLERIHIISAGADGTIYEEPWNWLRGKHKFHQMQHDHGWDYVLKHHPHLKDKVERAREIWHERNDKGKAG